MSHFTVLVIGDNWEDQLALYSELLEVDEYEDRDGEISTYNPKSKWDWYLDVDQCTKGELKSPVPVTFAVVKDGKWYESGEWGCVANKKAEDLWESEFGKLLDGLPDDTLLTIVDCHI
jgi:hypothetical protein